MSELTMSESSITINMFNNKQQKHEDLLEENRQLEFDFDTYGGGVENFTANNKK